MVSVTAIVTAAAEVGVGFQQAARRTASRPLEQHTRPDPTAFPRQFNLHKSVYLSQSEN